jgi:hypothetical protein
MRAQKRERGAKKKGRMFKVARSRSRVTLDRISDLETDILENHVRARRQSEPSVRLRCLARFSHVRVMQVRRVRDLAAPSESSHLRYLPIDDWVTLGRVRASESRVGGTCQPP